MNSGSVKLGVGTHLANLIESLGLKPMHECGCSDLQAKLDSMTIDQVVGIKNQIVAMLKIKQSSLGWVEYLKAGANSIKSGLVLKLNPLNPAQGLLEEAIRLAQADLIGESNEGNTSGS